MSIMSRASRVAFAVVLAVSGAATGAAAEEPAPGRDSFERSCVRCHADAGDLVGAMPSDPEDAREVLDGLLARHHAPDDATRREIVDYLVDLAGQ
jgi:mono/diheme cytochrome c family protein